MLYAIRHMFSGYQPQENRPSFEKTSEFDYLMFTIKEVFPDKTDEQIKNANQECLNKTTSPRSRSQYIRCLVKELSGY